MEQSVREAAGSSKVEEPVGGPRITTEERAMNQGEREPAGGYRKSTTLDHGQGEGDEVGFKEPWKLNRFALPPKGKTDRWDDALVERYGWMVRVHGGHRKMPFHPIHRSTPFEVEDLETVRITTIFNDEGAQVIQDQWKKAKAFPVRSRWTGYTFFKVKNRNQSTSSTSRVTTRLDDATARVSDDVESIISDGSFEKLDN